VKHIDYAIKIARELCESKFFKAIILHGSVARGEEREASDIDFLVIKKEARTQEYYQFMEEFFDKVRSMPMNIDIEFIELGVLQNQHDLKIIMEWCKDPTFYLNVLRNGLIFDGTEFSQEKPVFLKKIMRRMKKVLKK
jgi:predicted nucleotidyltransferase